MEIYTDFHLSDQWWKEVEMSGDHLNDPQPPPPKSLTTFNPYFINSRSQQLSSKMIMNKNKMGLNSQWIELFSSKFFGMIEMGLFWLLLNSFNEGWSFRSIISNLSIISILSILMVNVVEKKPKCLPNTFKNIPLLKHCWFNYLIIFGNKQLSKLFSHWIYLYMYLSKYQIELYVSGKYRIISWGLLILSKIISHQVLFIYFWRSYFRSYWLETLHIYYWLGCLAVI